VVFKIPFSKLKIIIDASITATFLCIHVFSQLLRAHQKKWGIKNAVQVFLLSR